MDTTTNDTGLSAQVARFLPYVRRYARALTGNQTTGDAYAAATLEAILEDRSVFDDTLSPRVALFRTFNLIWSSAGSPIEESDAQLERAAQSHLSNLTPHSREALLLHTLEEMSVQEVAQVLQVDAEEAQSLIDNARNEIEDSVAGKILMIEDEAIIAMDIHAIVTEMGHRVTGIGRTQDGAVRLGLKEEPDLILADIQLADNSSGIDAVNEILETVGEIPVVFITAFPERLLTGNRPEPAFVIAKPYTEDQVRSAVSQAMFFASTETLKAS